VSKTKGVSFHSLTLYIQSNYSLFNSPRLKESAEKGFSLLFFQLFSVPRTLPSMLPLKAAIGKMQAAVVTRNSGLVLFFEASPLMIVVFWQTFLTTAIGVPTTAPVVNATNFTGIIIAPFTQLSVFAELSANAGTKLLSAMNAAMAGAKVLNMFFPSCKQDYAIILS